MLLEEALATIKPQALIGATGKGGTFTQALLELMARALLVGEVKRVTDELLIVAAKALAALVSDKQISLGCLYPPLTEIRDVSLKIAVAAAQAAAKSGLARRRIGPGFADEVRTTMYDPRY